MGFNYFIVATLVVLLSLVLYITKRYRSRNEKISYLLKAVENNDFAFKFTEVKGVKFERIFNAALNRIKELIAAEKRKIKEQETYYEIILENVITGIIVVDTRGEVLQCNSKALTILGLNVFTSLSQLSRVDESLPQLFHYLKPGDTSSVSFNNERGEVNVSLKVSAVKLRGEDLRIIALNDIGAELEEKETESWAKLTRVLTHEIMNLTAPIASISETLYMVYGKEDENLGRGLETINQTGKGLISFVESYRRFTGVPLPVKKRVDILEFIDKIEVLMAEEMRSAQVKFNKRVEPGLIIYADESQLTQIMVNLFKNALHAMRGNQRDSTLGVDAYRIDGEVLIDVSNNGRAIPAELKDKIFVPFFTSKEEGSGIGLSISRQIMRLHNGTIKLKNSSEKSTTFTLLFRNVY